MIKNDLLQKVLDHIQSLDGWQDMELHHSALHGCNGNLSFFANLKFDTKNKSSFVKIDVDIFDENMEASVVETQQIIYLEDDDEMDAVSIFDFLQTQISYVEEN